MPARAEVAFTCRGHATGKMRIELDMKVVQPFKESGARASEEGPFHGSDARASPPLALFTAGLTGCVTAEIRAFAGRMDVVIDDIDVEDRVLRDWAKAGRVCVMVPESFETGGFLASPSQDAQMALIAAAKTGSVPEQTLGQANVIRHRLRDAAGFVEI